MNVSDFELVADILKSRSGVELPREKAYLLESRLNPVARKWSFRGFDELAQALRQDGEDALLRDIVQAMTITDTYFFRDLKPFRQFSDLVLPHLLQEKKADRRFRIWCAGCSSGQEPYSLAMLLKDREPELAGWRYEILGTDLSADMLARAKTGLYTQLEVQRGLPITYLVKYFEKQDERWRIQDPARETVEFQPFNLLDDMAPLGRFDIIFCRNVLKHLAEEVRLSVLNRMVDLLDDNGLLCLGLNESVAALGGRLQPIPGLHGMFGPFQDTPAEKTRLAS